MSTLSTALKQFEFANAVVALKEGATKKQVNQIIGYMKKAGDQSTRRLAADGLKDSGGEGEPLYLERLGLVVGLVDSSQVANIRSAGAAARLAGAPEISLIRPIRGRKGGAADSAAASAAKAAPNWGIEALGIARLHDRGLSGAGVRVGHLDTGIDASHPRFPKGAIAGWLETDQTGKAIADSEPYDDDGHGTHTAGTIAGRDLKKLPDIGAAPKSSLYVAKCIEGQGVHKRVLASLEWAAASECRIVSMSMGLRGYAEGWEVVMRSLRRLGILPVCAVGNEGRNTSRSPGNYATVLSVGMTNDQGLVDPDSSSQRITRPPIRIVPTIVAPGVDIASAKNGGGYEFLTGTSMATPLVAGLAALLMEAFPEATDRQIEAAIVSSARRPAHVPQARAGLGIPDAELALKQLE